MTNTLKHLSLLTRMENSGLKPRLTGKFPEDALDQACGRVETFQLQARLRTGNDRRTGHHRQPKHLPGCGMGGAVCIDRRPEEHDAAAVSRPVPVQLARQ